MATLNDFGKDHRQGPLNIESYSTRSPLLNIEVNIVANKPHHYILWGLAALFLGISASYGIVQAGGLALEHFRGPQAELAVQQPPSSTEQGSDDTTSTTTLEQQISGFYSVLNYQRPLSLSAAGYLVGDVDTGDIILRKNENTRYPMASVTKLMTAVVDLENLDQLAYATVTPASTKYYRLTGDLIMNEKIKVSDLKFPLLVVSSNVAAEVLANLGKRDVFLSSMNDKAKELEMSNTHYADPSGLDPGSISTAADLFKLAKYIKDNHPEVFDIGRIREYSILGHTWINQNHQLTYSTFAGGKNGFTDQAEQTTVSLFKLPFNSKNKNGTRTIAITLLHTRDRSGDVSRILNYLSANIRYEEKPLDIGSTQPGPAANGNLDR